MSDLAMVGPCLVCGIDEREWGARDTARTLALAPVLRRLWGDGAPAAARAVDDAGTGAPEGGPRAVHALWHELVDLAQKRDRRSPVAPQHGTVEQISASDGGVPKLAVAAAEVGRRGALGDRQRTRLHHGRPWQALCLWSGDVIDALVAEGHPISPGAAGENVTVRGIDWSRLRAGSVLDIGTVRCQLSAPAMPCSNINRWFADCDSRRIDHERHPGWSRWYASVLQPGHLATGDAVEVS
jgi:MOSC domain-containing protein YiiM